ncbi:hypothetical protein P5673_013834 [Acropora cervicornis]|uniref:Uncharacterized protein n=1 Tax=Acropora cervicornis TaxID=6130 RepID=A0AAD9QKJ8_ACRCE|nr:hypothetical protein P5673_013834 [Acropora cervicornis]
MYRRPHTDEASVTGIVDCTGRSKTNVKHNLNTTGYEILCDRKRSSRPWLLLPHAVFRLKRFTEASSVRT